MKMMIDANTKISTILKEQPAALEAIVSISSRFEKLRNPFLRKLMAGRTTVLMASRIGNCSVNTFFEKLRPFGFEIDAGAAPAGGEQRQLPAFLTSIAPDDLVQLDVRSLIEGDEDPLGIIMETIGALRQGQLLKVINTFEPVPLMLLLEKRGFESFADTISPDRVETYFYKKEEMLPSAGNLPGNNEKGWEALLQSFDGALRILDVRQLPMPGPMLSILEALDTLPENMALFVYHKRVPVFLLPELEQRNFAYRIKEVSDGEVLLLIFRS